MIPEIFAHRGVPVGDPRSSGPMPVLGSDSRSGGPSGMTCPLCNGIGVSSTTSLRDIVFVSMHYVSDHAGAYTGCCAEAVE